MSGTAAIGVSERGPSRSRFAVVLAILLGLGGCSNHWDWPIAALPYDAGWRPLPIKAWVLNDGVSAKAISICPRDSCARPGFAALLAFEGAQASEMERALDSDPLRLARIFAAPARREDSSGKGGAAARPAAQPKSATAVARFSERDGKGLLVEITARDGGKSAATAILYGRSAGRLVVALAVSPDAERARQDAAATWQSR